MQVDVERRHPPQHGSADAARGDHADVHALDVVAAFDAVGDIPAAVGRPLVGGNEIAHQRQDLHDGVLGDADAVAEGHLGDRDPAGDRGVEINMVRTDPGGEGKLEILRFGDSLGGQIRRPKWLGDHDIGVGQLPLKLRVRAFFVRCHHQLVPAAFQKFAQAELTGHAAQQLAGSEIDGRRGRQGLTAGVAVQHRDAVARVDRGIAGDRIRIENKQYLGHDILFI